MVVVVGTPRPPVPRHRSAGIAAGLAARIALAAARGGARVELVGKIGDDAAGDALATALARAGVGHAALLRDPSARTAAGSREPPPLERHDLELALRYLPGIRVLVLAEPLAPDAREAVDEAARFHGAHLVLITDEDATAGLGAVPERTTVLRPPDGDPDGFARLVAAYAARLDAGAPPGAAFDAATAEVGASQPSSPGGVAG